MASQNFGIVFSNFERPLLLLKSPQKLYFKMFRCSLLTAIMLTLFALPLTAQVKWKIPRSYQKKATDKKGNIIDMKVDYVQGKWQEVSRTPLGSNRGIVFSDTMFITITDREAIVKQGNQMTMKGEAAVQNRMLTAATEYFEITNLRNTEMTLKDDQYLRKMQRMDSYYFESFGKDSIQTERFIESVALDANNLQGQWVVYRKKADPGQVTTSPIIESLNISTVSDNTGTGEINFATGNASEKAIASFNFLNSQLEIKTANHSWLLDVYKADGKEFVFGEKHNILYFAIR